MTTRKRGFELVAEDMADYVSRTGRDATYALPSGADMLYLRLIAKAVDGQPYRLLLISCTLPAFPTSEDFEMLRRVFGISKKLEPAYDMAADDGVTIQTISFLYPHNPEAQP